MSHAVEAAYKGTRTSVRMSFLPCLKRQNDEQDETQERRGHGVGPPSSPSIGKSKNVHMPYRHSTPQQ